MNAAASLAEWAAWGLVFARLAPSGLALSLVSGGALPAWLGLALCLPLTPTLAHGVDVEPLLLAGAPALWLGVARELCLGAAFAAAAALPWLTLSYTLRGLAGMEVMGSEALARLYGLAALALCLAFGAPRAYVRALANSFAAAPPGGLAVGRAAWLEELLGGVSAALEATLALALPLWVSLWLIDATLALVARAAGHDGSLARAPLRGALGLLLLGLWLGPVSAHAPAWLRGALTAAGGVVARLAH